jgi:hypothetical protein
MKAEIWKLRGLRRGTGKGSCPLTLGSEDAKHILLRCPDVVCRKQNLTGKKWLNIHEKLVVAVMAETIHILRQSIQEQK